MRVDDFTGLIAKALTLDVKVRNINTQRAVQLMCTISMSLSVEELNQQYSLRTDFFLFSIFLFY